MPVIFDGAEGNGLPEYAPPCREFALPTGEVTFVHGYSGWDVGQWRFVALHLAGVHPPAEAPKWACELAQLLAVCRVAPGSEQRTFRLSHGGEKQAAEHLRKRLPGKFVEVVCGIADGLAMEGYLPPETEQDAARATGARQALREALDDRRLWGALDYLSAKLFGQRLVENRRPIGAVYQLLAQDRDRQEALIQAIGPLGGLLGGG